MPMTEAHELAHRVQERLYAEYPDAREIMVEPSPAIAAEGGSVAAPDPPAANAEVFARGAT
jgi:hypothetical protein